MTAGLFWASLFLLVYIWLGYYFTLSLVALFSNSIEEKGSRGNDDYTPSVTTIIAVHNEQSKIENRIKNLLKCDYPREKHEIVIASDGSTDATIAAAARFGGPVIVLDFKKNRGRALVHNDAVAAAKGEIIIFSDADTVFSLDFIRQIVDKFRNSMIGCVTSNLTYKTQGTAISDAEGIYFQLEKKIRSLESKIGILATASGPAMAIRKNLWVKLTPIDDCDFTTPLDVVLQGYKVVYAPDVVAFDIPPSSLKGEFKARVRMTSKNLIGTLRRWSFAGWFKHPVISWGLLSHKILRWLTSYFLLIAFFSNFALLDHGVLYQSLIAGQVVFYLLAVVGYAGEAFHTRIPIASTIFSFCVAMTGMGFGVVKGILGKAPAAYRMEE